MWFCRAAPLNPDQSYTIVTTRVDSNLRVYGTSKTLTGQQIQASLSTLPSGSPYYNPAATQAKTGHIATAALSVGDATPIGGSATSVAAEAVAQGDDVAAVAQGNDAAAAGVGRRKLKEQPEGAVYKPLSCSETDVRKFPNNVIGRIGLELDSYLPEFCTGQFISPVDILTAGHCLHLDFANEDFRPGQYGDDRRLFGT